MRETDGRPTSQSAVSVVVPDAPSYLSSHFEDSGIFRFMICA